MGESSARHLGSLLAGALALVACDGPRAEGPGETRGDDSRAAATSRHAEKGMRVHYLEIVTPEVDATCAAQAKLHGLSFGEPVAELGNARTAELPGGGILGVRAPMRDSEEPVVRPYVLVEDIEAAVAAAEAAGAAIALPPMELPGHGRCAIYVQGGIQHGLWEL